MEYYVKPFWLFHKSIEGSLPKDTYFIRKDYWSLIPNGVYGYLKGKELIQGYISSLEARLSKIIQKYSYAYWYHLSRRILPFTAGLDDAPQTIINMRYILTLAIQKYAQSGYCGHIAQSKRIKIEKVFNGLLEDINFKDERNILIKSPDQLVLTDFTHNNLREYYIAEKLAYEIWVCGAKMRSIAKGAQLFVDIDSKEYFTEIRSDKLEKLIESYDKRNKEFTSSKTGTVFNNKHFENDLSILLPVLNSNNLNLNDIEEFLNSINFPIIDNYVPNYLLMPFPIKNFYESHKIFSDNFLKKNDVKLITILFIITALCNRYLIETFTKNIPFIGRIFMRGYEGPESQYSILSVIFRHKDEACKILGVEYIPDQQEIIDAINYLTVDRKKVSLLHPSTIRPFIKYNSTYYFIDYSTIIEFLNGMFWNLELNKHSIKGDMLEKNIEFQKSYLLTKPLKSIGGSKKQIDYSIRINDLLIIVECKAVAMSSGVFSGDLKSLNFRYEKVIKLALKQADEKAKWLINNPIGSNYSLDGIKKILPIGVSAFTEYIPSLDNYYWINDEIPRVLSISEFHEFIQSATDIEKSYNILFINK